MTLTRRFVCVLIAVVLFATGLLLTILDEGTSKVFQGLLFGGLASFAAASL